MATEAHAPPGSGHRDVAAVMATIARLADGNCATAADVRLVSGTASTRPVWLKMTVSVGWSSTTETRYGTAGVAGSLHCDDANSVTNHLGRLCGQSCRDPAVSAGIADRLKKAPVAAFREWQDTHKLADLPHAAHWYGNCGNCAGHGNVDCPMLNCRNGEAPCLHCSQTGVGKCSQCGGGGSYTQYGQQKTCGYCNGSGRWGHCHMCLGNARVNCTNCGGRAEVRCKPCAGHGAFTYLYRAYLEGRVARTLYFEKGVPEGFRASCLKLPAQSMADGVGILRRTEATSGLAEATGTLHCEVRHVHATVAVKEDEITVDAVGAGLAIPLMPAFLDGLLGFGQLGGLTAESDNTARANPAARLSEATRTPVTRGILELVGGGKAVDAAAVRRTWKGAVSEGFVTRTETRLRWAYARAARSSVRATWLLATVPVAALMVLANAYHLPLLAFLAVWPGQAGYTGPAVAGYVVAQAAVAIPILLVAWLVAGHRARASLRAGVGSLAKARPRQGVWPWAGLAVAVAAGWMATVVGADASDFGLPFAPTSVTAGVQPFPEAQRLPYSEITCPPSLDGRGLSTRQVLDDHGYVDMSAIAGTNDTLYTLTRGRGPVSMICGYRGTDRTIVLPVPATATQCVNPYNTRALRCR